MGILFCSAFYTTELTARWLEENFHRCFQLSTKLHCINRYAKISFAPIKSWSYPTWNYQEKYGIPDREWPWKSVKGVNGWSTRRKSRVRLWLWKIFVVFFYSLLLKIVKYFLDDKKAQELIFIVNFNIVSTYCIHFWLLYLNIILHNVQ